MLPDDVTSGTAPEPTDEKVTVRTVPEEYAAVARFDPPWTPWFRRRNEVVLPVADPTGTP